MTNSVGTLAWAEAGGGTLSARDRLSLIGQLLTLLPIVPGELVSRACRSAPRVRALRIDPIVPISPIAQEAEQCCRAASIGDPWLYPHCARTYGFGLLFAEALRVDFDDEILWVAAMLHDIGLTTEAPGAPHAAACFAVRGSREVGELPNGADWRYRDRAAEAIALHINLRISRERSPEGYLVNLASSLDVAGLRYRTVYSDAMCGVLAEHPRHDFSAVIRERLDREAKDAPGRRECAIGRTRRCTSRAVPAYRVRRGGGP